MSPRPKKDVPLVDKLAEAFAAIEKMTQRGTNKTRRYKFSRATDVFEAMRVQLFRRGVLTIPNEGTPEYVTVATSNGGEQITECRLPVSYIFKDAKEEIGPYQVNGIGRDVEDKSLYKAQTGSRKSLLKAVGLIAEEIDDAEFDGQPTGETLDDVAPMRVPRSQQPATISQIRAFNEACVSTGKTADEISGYLLTTHKVESIEKLPRGKPFTQAIVWASDGAGTLAPKPQAAPALQGSLGLKAAPQPIEMKIGNKAVSFQPNDRATFSV